MKVFGRKGGKLVVEKEIRTTGLPEAIRLTADKITINAESGDVAHVKVEVVEESGYAVPDADNIIQLTAEGAGKLVGFNNGNPRVSASMKS